jgi:hypothetical protein
MSAGPRLSPQTIQVFEAFLQSSRDWRYGYDISRDTGLKSGTLYPREHVRSYATRRPQRAAFGEGKA